MAGSQIKAKINNSWNNANGFYKKDGKYVPLIINKVYEKLKDIDGNYILDKDGKYIWVQV